MAERSQYYHRFTRESLATGPRLVTVFRFSCLSVLRHVYRQIQEV